MIAFAVHGVSQELGHGLENSGIGKAGSRNLDVFIHPIRRRGPREMANAWASVPVLGMGSIETD